MITHIHIQNFRSIRNLTLDSLTPYTVFYGPNGSGKSNILDATARAFLLLGELISSEEATIPTKLLSEQDFHHGERQMVLSATVLKQNTKPYSLSFNITAIFYDSDNIRTTLTSIFLNISNKIIKHFPDNHGHRTPDFWRDNKINEIYKLDSRYFLIISAIRTLDRSSMSSERPAPGQYLEYIFRLLQEGRVTEALVVASNSPDPKIRRGFRDLQSIFEGAPLYRPHMEPVHDMLRKEYDLQEVLEGPNGDLRAVSVANQGLGVQQLYVILGAILLGGCTVAGLEEPEAHLHAPTSGRHLREMLRRVVAEGHVQQLFIATHSNLFDLDPSGWFDVSLVDGETRVERRSDWAEMDRRHLYEPGPARHALLDLLRYLPAETPVFRRASGEAVTGPEMVQMLIDDDPVAVEFLADVHAAAVRAVRNDDRGGLMAQGQRSSVG